MRLQRRVKELEAILSMLSHITTQMKFVSATAEDLLTVLCGLPQLSILRFLPLCREKFLQGNSFPDAWNGALKYFRRTSALSQNDLDMLSLFGVNFGNTDLEGQISNCALYTGLFETAHEEAMQKVKSAGKLYASAGTLLGILLVILLI